MIDVNRYMPIFMLDELEPFAIKAIGVTIFEKTRQSDSFPKREVVIEGEAAFAIEYAIWFDYDIQHLYELEHVWVYVDQKGNVCKVEGSFHGKYLVIADLDTGTCILRDETHPVVYMQPGKHAILPDPRLVKLIPGWDTCCNRDAGIDGVTIPEMIPVTYAIEEETQNKVKSYIKERFGFVPSQKYRAYAVDKELLITWKELKESIPERIAKELLIIDQWMDKE